MRIGIAQTIEAASGRVVQITVAIHHTVRLLQPAGNHVDAGGFAGIVQGQGIDHIGDFPVIDVGWNRTGAHIEHVLAHRHLPRLYQPLGKQFNLDPWQAAEPAHLHRWPILQGDRLFLTLLSLEGNDTRCVQGHKPTSGVHHQLVVAGLQVIEVNGFAGLGTDRDLLGFAAQYASDYLIGPRHARGWLADRPPAA